MILTGILSGIISGMGIGGGTILIPALTILFGYEQKTAQIINLLYFIPTATVSLIAHAKKGNIEKQPLPMLIFSGLVGAVLGSLLALRLHSEMLRILFGIFLMIMGIKEIFTGIKEKGNGNKGIYKVKDRV
jgi:hypothetical protein